MANYYDVTIKSKKLTQLVASEIIEKAVSSKKIRSFEFMDTAEGGYLTFNSRNLPDIEDIFAKYDLTDEEIEVKDEGDFESPNN